ncbi:hypothetical protein ccbrp13_13590 [Ktedonobacteria bacterium brp13]|nr:hypothetical protein ccbrp13_13590 [Ktedonobacteria bacterium brp13]
MTHKDDTLDTRTDFFSPKKSGKPMETCRPYVGKGGRWKRASNGTEPSAYFMCVTPLKAESGDLRVSGHASLGIRHNLLLAAVLVIEAPARNGRHFMLTKWAVALF